MNFFEQQDHARKKTGRLVVLFILAVICVVGAVNGIVYAIVSNATPEIQPSIFVATTGITLAIILGGFLYKTMTLASGGPSVARMLGGRPIVPGTGSADEQRIQNVVEEMAIASGVPVPQVYLLENESGINAFAAGWGTDDAVVGITLGAIQKLNRDELQGVVAHEFGHLFNGDTRLNLRLIGLLNGIMVLSLIGYLLLNSLRFMRFSSGRGKDKGAGLLLIVVIMGVGLWIIGSIGAFFGRLIQAAVSRQREYLADASAVQFTRNPAGLAGALKKIGAIGSTMQSPHAMEAAHLFFSNARRFNLAGLLATHPPLEDRIKAIDPTWDGQFDIGPAATQVLDETSNSRKGEMLASMLAGAAAPRQPIDPAAIMQQIGQPDPGKLKFAADLVASIPPEIASSAREPFSARAVIFAILASDIPQVREKQLAVVQQNVEPACLVLTLKLIDPVAHMSEGARLPLLDLAVHSLRNLAPQQAQRFRGLVRHMIEADGKVTLFEYALQRIVEKSLSSVDMQPDESIQYEILKDVRPDAAIVLSALADASGAATPRAFAAGAKKLNPNNPPDFVKVSGLAQVDASLRRLARTAPLLKQRLIDAMVATIAADGEVTVAEAELLRATAATLNVPLPPVMTN